MPKPPPSPPSSDIDGVHQDGMRPSKTLTGKNEGAAGLDRAERENVARPDHSDEESTDDRTS